MQADATTLNIVGHWCANGFSNSQQHATTCNRMCNGRNMYSIQQRCVHVSYRTVAYADDFVTEAKSIASLDRFDRIQFQMNFVFFPLN